MGPTTGEFGDTPSTEVRVYRHGRLLTTELCESEIDAAGAVARWCELDGVTCEVDDLTIRHRPGDVFEPEPALDDDRS